MKWIERRTTDPNDLETRLIERKFGLTGCAIWDRLQLIIADHMDGSNVSEWGYVAEGETMESLATAIRCTPKEFEDFVKFCDDNLILERREGRLFCPYVLDRMNEYARKVVKKEKTDKTEKPEATPEQKDGKSEKTDIPENPRNNTSQHHTVQTPHITNDLDSGGNRPEIATPLEKAIKDAEKTAPQGVRRETPPQGTIPKVDAPSTTGFSSPADILRQKIGSKSTGDIPAKSTGGGVSTEWQDKALRHIKGLNWELKDADKGRIMDSYKTEFMKVKFKATTDDVYSYLSDFKRWHELDDEAKIKYWFALRYRGIHSYEDFQKGMYKK